MLVLKITKNNFYGQDHPEGITSEVEYYKIYENLTINKLEYFIDNKINKSNAYSQINWEIIKIKNDEILKD